MVDHCSQVETVEYHTASELSQRAPLLLVVERREEGRGQRRLYNLRPFSGNSRRSSFPTPPRRARHPDAHSQSAVRDQRGSRRTLTSFLHLTVKLCTFGVVPPSAISFLGSTELHERKRGWAGLTHTCASSAIKLQ
ncbi:uncharacterized protein LOC144006415 isoform X5 [Festucalex cinctus]